MKIAYGTNFFIIALTISFCYKLASSGNITTGFLEDMMTKIQKERLDGLKKEHHHSSNHAEENYVTTRPAAHNTDDHQADMVLTKEQLLALYKIAIEKAASLNLANLLFHTEQSPAHHQDDHNHSQGEGMPHHDEEKVPGYYYYYYPIKSFLKDHKEDGSEMMDDMKHEMGEGHKGVEPLFVAMASFLGVAMMFIATILFLPKFGTLKSRRIIFKQGSEEFLTFTRLVTESIEGKDCSLRITCEVGRTIRNFRLGTKTIRVIEALLPPKLAKQLATIRRAASKKEKCSFIKCKNKDDQPVDSGD